MSLKSNTFSKIYSCSLETLLLTLVAPISDRSQPLFRKKEKLSFKNIFLDFQGHNGSFNESRQIVQSFCLCDSLCNEFW